MTISELKSFREAYLDFLKRNFDPVRAEREKAYLYSEMKHYGVKFGLRKRLLDKHKKGILALEKHEWLEWMQAMWEKPSFEERMLALDILSMRADLLEPDDMAFIETLIRESKGWALLDNFVMKVMEKMLVNYPETYDYLSRWIEDDDFWVRRSALLAQLLLFRRGEGDIKLFFKLAESQFDESWIDDVYDDTETRKRARFFVRKAIGWALRELSKSKLKEVFEFLDKNKSKMSGLSYREGSRNLHTTMQASF